MAGFVRRFTAVPPLEVITQIEGPVIVDLAPPDPVTGAGTGTVLLVGEFEDGLFATDSEAIGAVEVFAQSASLSWSQNGLRRCQAWTLPPQVLEKSSASCVFAALESAVPALSVPAVKGLAAPAT